MTGERPWERLSWQARAAVHHLVVHPIAGVLWLAGLDDAAEWLHERFDDPYTEIDNPYRGDR